MLNIMYAYGQFGLTCIGASFMLLLPMVEAYGANTVPIAHDMHAFAVTQRVVAIKARFTDPNYQDFTAILVDEPGGGSVVVNADTMNYTSDSGYVGIDSFTFKISDGVSTSGVARCRVVVNAPGVNNGAMVQVVVRDTLLPEISNKVARFEADLAADGYETKVTTLGNVTKQDLWSYLQSEYNNTNQCLQGAILIGALAMGGGDLKFWNMDSYGSLTPRRIWTSRIYCPATTECGDEVTLIKRALDHNHDFRVGKTRYPHGVNYYANDYKFAFKRENYGESLLDVWSWRKYTFGGDGTASAGYLHSGCSLYLQMSHGSENNFLGGVDRVDVHNYGAQMHFSLNESCSTGVPGGPINHFLFARAGCNIFAFGCVVSCPVDCFQRIKRNGEDDSQRRTRELLAQGVAWGPALLMEPYPFGSANITIPYGDLSTPVFTAPSNAMPRIVLSRDREVVRVDVPVMFSVDVSDDNAGDLEDSPYYDFEHQASWWFGGYGGGYNNGLADAHATNNNHTAGWTNIAHLYTSSGHRRVRVEVMDEWQAIAWKEMAFKITGWLPVLCWELDERLGLTAYDSSDRNNHGTVADNEWAEWRNDGRFGGVLHFDGHSTKVSATLPFSTFDDKSFTLALWVKSEADGQAAGTGIFNNDQFQIDLDGSGQYRYSGGTNVSFGAAPQNTWVHLAVKCNGYDSTLYYNGEQVAFLSGICNSSGFDTAVAGVDTNGTKFFTGAIDDIRLYKAPASRQEIQELDPPFELVISSNVINEAGGTCWATLTRTGSTSNDIVFQLSSDDTDEATVPETVTIPAGQSSSDFLITAVDDTVLDGSSIVRIEALYYQYRVIYDTLIVADSEKTTITLNVPDTDVTEGEAPKTVTVTLGATPDTNILVHLISSDETEIGSSYFVVPAGQTRMTGNMLIVDDNVMDKTQRATLTAHVENWTDDSELITVHDNEHIDIMISLPSGAGEGDGVLANAGMIYLSGIVTANVDVALASLDETELTVTSSVTIVAGTSNVCFDLTIIDDLERDGLVMATVTADAPGFNAGSETLPVADSEWDHLVLMNVPSPQTGSIPFELTVRMCDRDGSNASFNGTVDLTGYGDSGPVPLEPVSVTLDAGQWTGMIQVHAQDTGVVITGRYDTASAATLPFDVVHGPLDHLELDLPSEVEAKWPFAVTIRAVDYYGYTVLTYTDAVELAVCTVMPEGSDEWDYPLQQGYADNRCQSIYFPGDISLSGTITALALDVASRPENEVVRRILMRMKHTTDSTAGFHEWRSFTYVLNRADQPVNTGLSWFRLDTPFEYNGADNLMVDFLVDGYNDEGVSGGICRTRATSGKATIHLSCAIDGWAGNPEYWSGDEHGEAVSVRKVPNIHMRFADIVAPGLTGRFVGGVWNGELVISNTYDRLALLATKDALSGISGAFAVLDEPLLYIAFDELSISENEGTTTATVSRTNTVAGDLVVSLLSSDETEAVVTNTLTISNGQSSAEFTVTGVDDVELDGSQTVIITASALNYRDGVNSIEILDHEASLTVVIDSASISENNGFSQATVTRVNSTGELEVALSSSDTNEAVVPESVTISNGQGFAEFTVNAVNDDEDDGNRTVTVTATATGHFSDMDTIVVDDDEFSGCKMKIGFVGYDKGTTLTDFPALVILNTNRTNFSYDQFASANGWDLRFKDASQTTDLSYEVETWNDAGSNSFVWVRVPELTNGTHIWAYWGYPELADSPAAYTTNGATWGAEYRGVWHMTEPNAADSTANGNSGTSGGSAGVSVVSDGKIGPALDFMPSAGNGYVDLPGGGTLLMGQSFTFSAWVRWDGGSSPGYAMIASKKNKYSDANGWCIETHRDNHNVKVLGSSGGGPERDVTIGSGWTDHNWTYLACVYNGANVTIYADGGPVDSGGIAAVVDRADRKLVLGNEADHGAANWNGLMDEVRCAVTLRSADWVWACWSNQVEASTFCTYGEVEVGGGGGADSDGDGMPDAYETRYGFNVSSNDAAGDADGDGMSNYGEFRSGTSPTNALSVLRFEAAAPGSPSEITLIWQSVSGKLYSILISTDLLDTVWDVIDSNLVADPPTNTYPVNVGSDGSGYYRIKVE